ncbi:hypothetical protein N9450_01720 [Gammaproteobacteria bacterium]|nr:hypothetical protein [Gammaproteobacteria bacterium]
MATLAKDFDKRATWLNNRASCIFPFFLGKDSDTHILFQDYWGWKNNIDKIFCILRLRDSLGDIILNTQIEIKKHNEILISDLIADKSIVDAGTVEIEIISPENLGYPFPAVLAFYVTKNHKSVVHAAGRILNSNENFNNGEWKESNFTIKLEDDFNPFICLFYGQYVSDTSEIKLIFKDYENNSTLLENSYSLKPTAFGSKVLYLKDLLSKTELELLNMKKVFVIFETEIKGIFGRFVVGNLHTPSKQHFTTHSFQYINPESKDRISSSKNECSTFLPIFNKKPLKVNVVSFPTNVQENLRLQISKGSLNESIESTEDFVQIQTGGNNASVFEYQLETDDFYKLESFSDAPSRINVNYNFSLKNSLHATDLATGFKAKVYPPKTNHWGSSILEKNWKTIIFIRNLDHKSNSREALCSFEAFTNHEIIKKELRVKPESCNIIEINGKEFKKDCGDYFSWKLSASETTLEVFWVSYNELNGAIVSEHSF